MYGGILNPDPIWVQMSIFNDFIISEKSSLESIKFLIKEQVQNQSVQYISWNIVPSPFQNYQNPPDISIYYDIIMWTKTYLEYM